MARGASYLKRRGDRWYVQLAVPLAAQRALGTKVLTRSLQTGSRGEAERRKHAVLAEFQSQVAAAAALTPPSAPLPKETAADLLALAVKIREDVEAGTQDPEHADAGFDALTDEYLDQQARKYGRDSEGRPRLPPEELAQIRRAHKALAGRLEYTLARLAERFLEESSGHLTAQTLADKRRWLLAFVGWFGGDREGREVDRAAAGRYVAEVIQRRTLKDSSGTPVPLSATTRKKEVSALRSFFAWLVTRGIIDANPFDRMSGTVQASTRGKRPARRPWSAAELGKVLRGIPPNDPLWSLTVLAAYTGMRREEVAELGESSIDGDVLRVEDGKTAAAIRRVPIHPTIRPLVQQLAATTKDGYLLPGLLRGGPDGKRAWYLGKRFGRAIRKLGIDDPALDFHALRGTFITQLESAGVPESTIQLIVGHKRQGMTLGVYSGGVPDKVKREAIGTVSYGKALDAFVMKTGRSVVVAPSAKPRRRRT